MRKRRSRRGLVRPLDPNIKLPERARVIIVAAEGANFPMKAGDR
jgi:hypothetical protein